MAALKRRRDRPVAARRIFLKRAGTIILGTPSSCGRWPASRRPDRGKAVEVSIAGKIASGIEVVVRPIGFNQDIALALLPAMARARWRSAAIATVYSIDARTRKSGGRR